MPCHAYLAVAVFIYMVQCAPHPRVGFAVPEPAWSCPPPFRRSSYVPLHPTLHHFFTPVTFHLERPELQRRMLDAALSEIAMVRLAGHLPSPPLLPSLLIWRLLGCSTIEAVLGLGWAELSDLAPLQANAQGYGTVRCGTVCAVLSHTNEMFCDLLT